MKYRLQYEYEFAVAKGGSIEVEEKKIANLAIWLEISVYKDGREIVFENNLDSSSLLSTIATMNQKFMFTDNLSVYLYELLNVIYDAKNGYRVLATPIMEFAKSIGYGVLYKVVGYEKSVIDIDDDYEQHLERVCYSEKIDKPEFIRILKSSPEKFICKDNYPTQVTNYNWEIADENNSY